MYSSRLKLLEARYTENSKTFLTLSEETTIIKRQEKEEAWLKTFFASFAAAAAL